MSKNTDLCGMSAADAIAFDTGLSAEGNTSDHDHHRASDDGMPVYDGNEDDLGVKWGPSSVVADHTPTIDTGDGNYDPEVDRKVTEAAIAFLRSATNNPSTKRWALFQYDVESTGGDDGEAIVKAIRLSGTIDDGSIVQAALRLAGRLTTMDI